jgi:Rieske Fe-S protein
MRLVERWTRAADDRIDYSFTVEDPSAWAKPWSARIAWNKTGYLFECACHGDNYSLYGILSGARAQEKKK